MYKIHSLKWALRLYVPLVWYSFLCFFRLEQYEEYLFHVSTTISRLDGLKVLLNKNNKAFLLKCIFWVSCASDMQAEVNDKSE